LTPLLRPEGIVVMLIWSLYLLRSRKVRLLPYLLVGGSFWLLAAWLITGDPLYPMQDSYRLSPGFRSINWDYFLKFYDDFSGPIWFVAIIAGLVVGRVFKLDIIHAIYIALFLFFALIRDNIEDLPPRHFGWRFIASTAPLVTCYALAGLNLLFDTGCSWSGNRGSFLKVTLVGLGLGWIFVALIYLKRGNPYAVMLLLLSCLGSVAVLSWLCASYLGQRWVRPVSFGLIVMAVAFTLFKAPPYRSNEKDFGVRRLATWWLSEDSRKDKQVWTALHGFYYFTKLDPVVHRTPDRLIPGRPGDTVIWDSWGMGRWARISFEKLESEGYKKIACPVRIPGLDLRVYRKPSDLEDISAYPNTLEKVLK